MFRFLRPNVEFSRRITTQAVRLWCLSHWTSFFLLGFVTSRSLNKMILTIKRKRWPRESKQRKESTVHNGFQSWQKVLLKEQKFLKVIRTGIWRPTGCICKLQNINLTSQMNPSAASRLFGNAKGKNRIHRVLEAVSKSQPKSLPLFWHMLFSWS